jgi:hypothetical protein
MSLRPGLIRATDHGQLNGRDSCMRRSLRLGLAVAWTLTWGCATTASTRFEGISGGVAWEVVDIVQSVASDYRAIRWDYTVVLRETSGTPVNFSRLETQTQADARSRLMAGTEGSDFRRRLEAHSELRLNGSYTVSFTENSRTRAFESPGSRENYLLYHRFVGKTEAGVDVSVLVSFPLSAGIGRRVAAPEMTGALPPRRIVRPPELKLLAGTWVGGYRNGVGIDVPIRVVL